MTIFKVAYCFFHVFPLNSQRLFLFYTATHYQSLFKKGRLLTNNYSFFVTSIEKRQNIPVRFRLSFWTWQKRSGLKQNVDKVQTVSYKTPTLAPSSSGLGHRPLTPGTGVRVPLGSPSKFKHLALLGWVLFCFWVRLECNWVQNTCNHPVAISLTLRTSTFRVSDLSFNRGPYRSQVTTIEWCPAYCCA